jgi:hypothetical protein
MPELFGDGNNGLADSSQSVCAKAAAPAAPAVVWMNRRREMREAMRLRTVKRDARSAVERPACYVTVA